MTKFVRFLKWASKAWPVLWILLILIVHLSINTIPNIDKEFVNELVGIVLPFVGVFFILYSINEDFQDFRNSDMFTSFKEYLKSCPCRKHKHVLATASIHLADLMAKITATVNRKWNSTEERLEELERRFEDLRSFVSEINKDVNTEIAKLRLDLMVLDGDNKERIRQVSDQLDKSVMGKVTHQIFGVFLIVYGFIVNILNLVTNRI